MRLRRGTLDLVVDPIEGTTALVDDAGGPDVDVIELDEDALAWLVQVGGPAALAHVRRGRGLREPERRVEVGRDRRLTLIQ